MKNFFSDIWRDWFFCCLAFGLFLVPMLCRADQLTADAVNAAASSVVASLNTMSLSMGAVSAVFAIPDSADVATIWGVGFVFPMVGFLVAWAFAQLLSMFRPSHDDD